MSGLEVYYEFTSLSWNKTSDVSPSAFTALKSQLCPMSSTLRLSGGLQISHRLRCVAAGAADVLATEGPEPSREEKC